MLGTATGFGLAPMTGVTSDYRLPAEVSFVDLGDYLNHAPSDLLRRLIVHPVLAVLGDVAVVAPHAQRSPQMHDGE